MPVLSQTVRMIVWPLTDMNVSDSNQIPKMSSKKHMSQIFL